MGKLFNKTFFKFTAGFASMLLLGFVGILLIGYYGSGDLNSGETTAQTTP